MLCRQYPDEGSSPRIRGEYVFYITYSTSSRIIPANTGRITLSCPSHASVGDHPREYGENNPLHRTPCTPHGSSPRIRGESHRLIPQVHLQRIIPANTGRIQSITWTPHWCRDHPREYGENLPHHCGACSPRGSSPRIRGECRSWVSCRRSLGIIPANTGRISVKPWTVSSSWDHPREYGENNKAVLALEDIEGSSPRIRGEYHGEHDQTDGRRIIPANTGRIE